MHSGQGEQKQNLLIPLSMTFLKRKSESADMEEDCRVDETGTQGLTEQLKKIKTIM